MNYPTYPSRVAAERRRRTIRLLTMAVLEWLSYMTLIAITVVSIHYFVARPILAKQAVLEQKLDTIIERLDRLEARITAIENTNN